MFDFLEREGAQVIVEPIATWVAYLMYQAKAHAHCEMAGEPSASQYGVVRAEEAFRQLHRPSQKAVGHRLWRDAWNFFYHRTIKNMGGITHHLVPQTELAEMADPFYNQFARGGEGHLEVGKNVYYTVHKMCHMVLALKPLAACRLRNRTVCNRR